MTKMSTQMKGSQMKVLEYFGANQWEQDTALKNLLLQVLSFEGILAVFLSLPFLSKLICSVVDDRYPVDIKCSKSDSRDGKKKILVFS